MLLALLFATFLIGSTVDTTVDENLLPYTPLAARLAGEPSLVLKVEGTVVSIFGLPLGDARMVLLRVSHQRPLPEGYVPPDLVRVGGRSVRGLIVPDLTA